jgi:hypothetical protein
MVKMMMREDDGIYFLHIFTEHLIPKIG